VFSLSLVIKSIALIFKEKQSFDDIFGKSLKKIGENVLLLQKFSKQGNYC